jgi:hypothetical protein
MKWILKAMQDEYGVKKWRKMSDKEQLHSIAVFMYNYTNLFGKNFATQLQ